MVAVGQKYGNVWEFGEHAGINFNSCHPVAITNGNNPGFEGCGSISDTSGQLLFYTNSDTVWNKLNQFMPNGNLVASYGTLSQVIIFRKPLSNSLYYIVTTKIQAMGTLSLQYHIVDMSLNSGLGGIASKNNVITTTNITEQVSATMNSNGTDIWLMVHEYATNHFMTYIVTSAGISLVPIISAVGPVHIACTSNINARGEIKFSPDASKIAFNANGVGGNNPSNILTLFDFDNSSGIVSNPLNLPFSRGDWGLSFSPDNSKLYGTTWKAFNFGLNDYNYLYQFDLSSGVPATIINSKQILDSILPPISYGDLKLGPDGKIYVARYYSYYLGVINFPDLAGSACNYDSNGVYLGGKRCRYGLNNYIEYNNYCNSTSIAYLNEYKSSINIFPNPGNGEINITSTSIIDEIVIRNVLGQVIYKATPNEKNMELKVDIDGIYCVSVRSEKGVITKKIIVQ